MILTKSQQQNLYGGFGFIIAATLAIGWVFPSVPFVRRMPEDKAFALYQEYMALQAKPQMELEDTIRRNEIAVGLGRAGYYIVPTDAGYLLLYPDYAK